MSEMETLPGMENAGLVTGNQEKSAVKFVRDFFQGKTMSAWDNVYAVQLINIARSIDSYIDLRKNPSTLFDSYNQVLDRIKAMHPETDLEDDEELADIVTRLSK